jgi:hypothetical protein
MSTAPIRVRSEAFALAADGNQLSYDRIVIGVDGCGNTV